MRKFLTDKEIKEKLKTFEIIVDTREHEEKAIIQHFADKKIPTISRALSIGDYSIQLDGITYESDIAFECKMSLDELSNNFTAERERFEREFLRAKANGTKVFLLIENGSWDKIKKHEYRSKLEPKAFMGSLLQWGARYNITVMFCESSQSAELIYSTFYYWLKNKLEHD